MLTLTRFRNHPLTGDVAQRDPFLQMVDRFFHDIAQPVAAGDKARGFKPPVDIVEKDNAFLATVDLPGLKKEDIEISLDEGVLTLSGERKLELEEGDENKSYRRIERSYGAFSRSFTLPQGVDLAKVEATFADGVLKLTLPKSEAAKARKIAIA
jgi:HSP20 family protein